MGPPVAWKERNWQEESKPESKPNVTTLICSTPTSKGRLHIQALEKSSKNLAVSPTPKSETPATVAVSGNWDEENPYGKVGEHVAELDS